MKYHGIFFIVVIFIIGCSFSVKHIHYEGMYADDLDGNGLYNPARGFRLEVHVPLPFKKYDTKFGGHNTSVISELNDETHCYFSDSVSLVQTYFYISDLIGKKFSSREIDNINYYFETLRKIGKKAVLRFAYETDIVGHQKGPNLEQVLSHIEQLKPIIEHNKDVIFVVQAGFIGAWGEWHSSVMGLDRSDDIKRTILKKILWMVPKDRYVQVREPEYKNLLKSDTSSYNRISFHDDFIVVKPHKWDGRMHEGTPAFAQMVKESPYLPVDGELPWGYWSVLGDPLCATSTYWLIDGGQVARKLFLQHFSSLSIIHNYKEKSLITTKDFSMKYWKKDSISIDFLKKNKMPFSPNYFKKKNRQRVVRSQFDYIRDHLGYRIELNELNIPDVIHIAKNNHIELDLFNRGFSTIYNEHSVYFVLIDKHGSVSEFATIANPNTWQPYAPSDNQCKPLLHKISTDIQLPKNIEPGNYKLGLWIPDGSASLRYNPRFAIRCANTNMQWWTSSKYGVNILTNVEVDK